MLVLSRKEGQRIMIGDEITIVVSRIKGNRVSIAIEAPEQVRIVRGELESIAESFDEEPKSADCPAPLGPPHFNPTFEQSATDYLSRSPR